MTYVVLFAIVCSIIVLYRYWAHPDDPQYRQDFDDWFGGLCFSGETGCTFVILVILGVIVGCGLFIYLLASH